MQNGVDFDARSVISALNDGVGIKIDELEKGYSSEGSDVVYGELYVDYTTADNKDYVVQKSWGSLDVISADEGLTVENGEIRVTADGTVVLSDSETTVNIVITNYSRLLAEELEANGVSIEVLEGSVPAGSKVEFTDHTEEETQALVSEYNIEATENSGSFDVSIAMPEGGEYTEEGAFKVTVDAPAVEVPEGATAVYKVYHIHDGNVDKIEASVADGKLSFVTGSFSNFVYTVDFEFTTEDGSKIAWSWPGEGSYSIASIMAEIGVTGEIGQVDLERTNDVGGSENAFYLEEKEDGWYLTSDEAFLDTFELTVVVGEKSYVLVITDLIYTNDLSNMLESIVIDGAQQTEDGYVVKPGTPYQVHLKFKENNYQFNQNGSLIYTLPAGLTANASNSFTIEGDELGEKYYIDGNTVSIVGNQLQIQFNTSDPNYESYFKGLTTGEFWIDITGVFTHVENAEEYIAGTKIEFDETKDLNVYKSGRIVNFDTGEVEYSLNLVSVGPNGIITLTDEITGDALTLANNPNFIVYDSNGQNVTSQFTFNKIDDQKFTVQTPDLNTGTYTIKYTAHLDPSMLDKDGDDYGTAADTNNTVSGIPNKDPVSYNLGHIVTKPTLSKGAGNVTVDQATGKATIPWTISATSEAVDEYQLKNVTDEIKSEGMTYSGDGITVHVYDSVTGEEVTGSPKTVSWADMTNKTDTTWSYDMSTLAGLNNAGKKWRYEISYTTEIDVSDNIETVNVSNGSTTENGGGSTQGSTNVQPLGKNAMGIGKTADRVTANTIRWRITLKVPATGLSADKAVFKDVFPTGKSYNETQTFKDTYVSNSLTFDSTKGLLSSETCSPVVDADGNLILYFTNSDVAEGATDNGLKHSDNGREIVFTLETT